MSKFEDVLDNDITSLVTLPLLHTCDAFSLRSIIEEMQLVPQKCDVFNIELIYTYYGIPSYRSNYKKATQHPAFYMICLILDGDKFNDFHKVYPFDSGAFEKLPDFKNSFFHPKNKIKDFEVNDGIGGAKKIVKTFYNSNQNYVVQSPQIHKKFGVFDFEAISYSNLINSKINSSLDDRTSSIELIFDKKIELNSDTVKQLIIPSVFLDDTKVKSLIKSNLGIETPITYSTFKGSPIENFGQIRNEYFKFMNN